MGKDTKKIVAAVVYGVSLVALVTGFFSLFISMLTRCVYPDLSIGSTLRDGQRIHLTVLLVLSFVFATAFVVLAVCQLFLQKRPAAAPLRTALYVMTCVLFANLIWAMAAALSLGDGDVAYDRFIFFQEALVLVAQFFFAALFLIVSEIFLRRYSAETEGETMQNGAAAMQNGVAAMQNGAAAIQNGAAAAPAVSPVADENNGAADLTQLQKLRDANLISPEEFEERKARLMYDNAAAALKMQWQLYCSGLITEEEYQQLKKKILNLK